jgi:type IV pilus assembly protein PilC
MLFKKLYLWQGVDVIAEQKLGLEEASSKRQLDNFLNFRGIYQIKSIAIAESVKKKKLSLAELLTFLRAILSYLKIGVSLQDILPEVSKQFFSPLLKYVSYNLYLSLHKGENLKTAFSNLSQNFPLFFSSIIKISSDLGDLEKVFQDALNFYEKVEQREKKLQAAIQYPLFVLSFTIIMVFLILYFIMPMFQGVYFHFEKGELPVLTQVAVFLSDFLRMHLLLLCAFGFLLFLCKQKNWLSRLNPLSLFSYAKAILQRKLLDPLLFSYSTHNLLKQAVPLDKALEITANMLTKPNRKKAVTIAKQLHQGKNFYQACRQVDLYWKEFSALYIIAEKTGDLALGLKNIYKFWDEKFDAKINQLSKTLHLCIIVFSGIIIFLVFLAIYLPLLAIGSFDF